MLWYVAEGASPGLRAFLAEYVGTVDSRRCRFAFDPLTGVLHWRTLGPAAEGDSDGAVLEEGQIDVPSELIDECAERF